MIRCENIVGPVGSWIGMLLSRVETAGISTAFIKSREIDHLCYRCHSKREYLDVKSKLTEDCMGRLIVEGMIAGRPISTVELLEPIKYEGWSIPCIEIACPKPGKTHKEGLEHIEVVIGNEGDNFCDSKDILLSFVSRHPTVTFDLKAIDKDINADVSIDLGKDIGSIKFHVRPLIEVCKYERANGLVQPVPEDYFEE